MWLKEMPHSEIGNGFHPSNKTEETEIIFESEGSSLPSDLSKELSSRLENVTGSRMNPLQLMLEAGLKDRIGRIKSLKDAESEVRKARHNLEGIFSDLGYSTIPKGEQIEDDENAEEARRFLKEAEALSTLERALTDLGKLPLKKKTPAPTHLTPQPEKRIVDEVIMEADEPDEYEGVADPKLMKDIEKELRMYFGLKASDENTYPLASIFRDAGVQLSELTASTYANIGGFHRRIQAEAQAAKTGTVKRQALDIIDQLLFKVESGAAMKQQVKKHLGGMFKNLQDLN